MRRLRTLRHANGTPLTDGGPVTASEPSRASTARLPSLSRSDYEEPRSTEVLYSPNIVANCGCNQQGKENDGPPDAPSYLPSMDDRFADIRRDEADALGRPLNGSGLASSATDSSPLNSPATKARTCGRVPQASGSDRSEARTDLDECCGKGSCSGTSDDSGLEGLVFVVGEALLDVCAEVDQLFLTKYGLNMDDVIRARPEHENILADMQANWKCYTTPGGSSQNTARVMQWVLGVRRTVSVFGCIGADRIGEQLANYMKKSGVRLRYAIDDTQSTGVCCVCMVGSHRSIVTNVGAGGSLSLDHLRDTGTRRMMQRAKLFYLESYGLSKSSGVLREVADYATQHNVPLAINLSARFICTQYVDALRQLIEHADIVFGNRCEARSFAVASQLPADGIAEIARLMCALPKKNGYRGRIVVITSGPQPTVVAERGVVSRYAVPALSSPDQLVDAIGAGDSFAGGFLAGTLIGVDTARCVEMGHICSRFVIGRRACDIPSDQPPPVNVNYATLVQLKR